MVFSDRRILIPDSLIAAFAQHHNKTDLNISSGTNHMMSSISFFNDLQFYLVFGLKHLPNHQKQHAVVPKISSAFPNSRTL